MPGELVSAMTTPATTTETRRPGETAPGRRARHLFIIEAGAYRGADIDEVAATIDGLTQMGLCRLPYDHDVYIQIPAGDIVNCGDRDVRSDPACVVTFGPLGEGNTPDVLLQNLRTGFSETLLDGKTKHDATSCCAMARALLITLLATRNVVKATRENKLAKLGIGKKSLKTRYAYTTTISLPKIEDMDDDEDHPPGAGATRCPHLRRGHIRSQHHGPRNQLVKRIWIAPVFVNADEGFVATRAAYNVIG